MAEKLEIGIDLTALAGAFVHTMTSRSGVSKKLVSIPVDALYEDRQGRVWVNVNAFPCEKNGSTHYLKQNYSKAVYASLPTDEQGRKNTPIIGNVKASAPVAQSASPVASGPVVVKDDDLPF